MPAPHIADQVVFFLQAQASVIDLLSAGGSILRHIQALCFCKTGQGGGGADRMAGIGVAMADGGAAGIIMFKHIGNLWRNHHRAKREIAICDRLGGAGKVRLHTPMA